MKRSEAARYARWSAAAAGLLAMLTVGVYLERKWVAHRERAKAPPPAPRDVTRLSSGLTFSKVQGNQKIFTVEALKATDFKDKAASLMEDVTITIFGNTGARHDSIHTKSCQYEKDGGSIVCSGDVQLDLQSAEDAERGVKRPGATTQKVQVETRGVTFDRATGIAQSDQPVKFVFPNGQGEAVGVEYHSEEGAVRLLRDVNFSLIPAGASPKAKSGGTAPREPVHVTGKSADFERDSRVLRLRGPVEARTSAARLQAGEVILALDKGFHAEKLVAAGTNGKNPELESRGRESETHLSGETLTASFAPDGSLTRIEASGGVKGSQQSEKDADEFSADNASVVLRPRENRPKDLNLKGNVRLASKMGKTGESRTLQTSALLVEFAERKKGERSAPERAETLARGTLEWTDPALQPGASATTAETGPAQTRLSADKLELKFGPDGKANLLVAGGNVQTERTLPGKPVQTATAQNGNAQLPAGGGWSQMDLRGDVKLKEGDRSGQADRVTFVRSAQTATLTGNAVVRDTTTETRAPRITFAQSSGEIRADGGVRSTDFSSKATSLQLAAAPANISADTLGANSKTGRALYAGHARLWQGDSVMEAESIELFRETKVLNASGNIRAVFPQSPDKAPPRPVTILQRVPSKVKLWHITAGTLSYIEPESRAHLEKNVVAQSADQVIRAPLMDLYFTRSEKNAPAAAGTSGSSTTATGSQQISRAVATGGVTVEQGSRRATAERGEYSAADGKFVMSGGNPTIFDASEGTTTGRQLTFFLADDTIIVDSENGSRTLTKHRVEK
jgi:lipopolysaccharide export system protein LptA